MVEWANTLPEIRAGRAGAELEDLEVRKRQGVLDVVKDARILASLNPPLPPFEPNLARASTFSPL